MVTPMRKEPKARKTVKALDSERGHNQKGSRPAGAFGEALDVDEKTGKRIWP